MKFKIDVSGSSYYSYALFVRRGLLFKRWEYVRAFKTYGEAKAQYEAIKHLPEYLA